jgi:hypothetical protein
MANKCGGIDNEYGRTWLKGKYLKIMLEDTKKIVPC